MKACVGLLGIPQGCRAALWGLQDTRLAEKSHNKTYRAVSLPLALQLHGLERLQRPLLGAAGGLGGLGLSPPSGALGATVRPGALVELGPQELDLFCPAFLSRVRGL